jgi:ADP-heptose:LPS heptosyltransferase
MLDRMRSLTIGALETLVRAIVATGGEPVSLQVGPRQRDLSDIPHAVADWGEGFADFADTAAAIQELDLVISVDSAVAHLAGALGAPVWVLLPYVPEWRWLENRADSPWYPTMRLFRQTRLNDWSAVVDEVGRALTPQATGSS